MPSYLSKATDADWKYLEPERPRAEGHLAVSANPPHKLYWHEYGNPNGEPVMVVHGGPGGETIKKYARYFDPERYRIIMFDQRGCGKSEPSVAKDPDGGLSRNTTDDTINDMEKLRARLGVKGKMHVFGGSWGSTLAMAYAIQKPEHVKSLALRGIFLVRRQDLDYFYQGNAEHYAEKPLDTKLPGAYQVFPEAWKEFVEVIPPEKRGDMVRAYAEIFAQKPTSPEGQAYQDRAASAWTVWEGVTSYLAQDLSDLGHFADPEFGKTFARVENHYFMNGGFLGGSGETNRDQNYLLENVDKIKDIPIRIVQGQYDQVCPRFQADELVAALKEKGATDVQYVTTPAGHSMMERENVQALTQFMEEMPYLTLKDKSSRSQMAQGQ